MFYRFMWDRPSNIGTIWDYTDHGDELLTINGGVHSHGDQKTIIKGDSLWDMSMISHREMMGYKRWYPNSWMVYFREHPIQKWMITRGIPISGNL